MNDNANALRSKNAKRAMQKRNAEDNQKRTLSAPKIEQQAQQYRKRAEAKRGKHLRRAGNPRSAKRSEPRKRPTANQGR